MRKWRTHDWLEAQQAPHPKLPHVVHLRWNHKNPNFSATSASTHSYLRLRHQKSPGKTNYTTFTKNILALLFIRFWFCAPSLHQLNHKKQSNQTGRYNHVSLCPQDVPLQKHIFFQLYKESWTLLFNPRHTVHRCTYTLVLFDNSSSCHVSRNYVFMWWCKLLLTAVNWAYLPYGTNSTLVLIKVKRYYYSLYCPMNDP